MDIMSLKVGTIITRYHPLLRELTCEDGVCVGKILRTFTYANYHHVEVTWWETCSYHNYDTSTNTYLFLHDEIWEIGQIPEIS